MRGMARRVAALLLALWLALFGLIGAAADGGDWRDLLRGLYDNMEQTESGDEETGFEFELPVTDPQQVVNYLHLYGELPENFITKAEAQALGWDKRYNYVGEVAPGMSIGGDRFGNYEGSLPEKKGRRWFECDVNYDGRQRGPERLLYSSDGLYFYTDDHYQTFIEMFPEDEP